MDRRKNAWTISLKCWRFRQVWHFLGYLFYFFRSLQRCNCDSCRRNWLFFARLQKHCSWQLLQLLLFPVEEYVLGSITSSTMLKNWTDWTILSSHSCDCFCSSLARLHSSKSFSKVKPVWMTSVSSSSLLTSSTLQSLRHLVAESGSLGVCRCQLWSCQQSIQIQGVQPTAQLSVLPSVGFWQM